MPKSSPDKLDFRQHFDAATTFTVMVLAQFIHNDSLNKLKSVERKTAIRNFHHCQHDNLFLMNVFDRIQALLSRGGILNKDYIALLDDMGSYIDYLEQLYVTPINQFSSEYYDIIFMALSEVASHINDEVRDINRYDKGEYLNRCLCHCFGKYLECTPIIDVHSLARSLSQCVVENGASALCSLQLHGIVHSYLEERAQNQRNRLIDFAVYEYLPECAVLEVNIAKDIPFSMLNTVKMTPFMLLRILASLTNMNTKANDIKPFLSMLRSRMWAINSSTLEDRMVTKLSLKQSRTEAEFSIQIHDRLNFDEMTEEEAREKLEAINQEVNYLILAKHYRGRETYQCAYFKRNDSIKSYVAAVACIALEEFSKRKGSNAYKLKPKMSFDDAFKVVDQEMMRLDIAYEKDGYEQVRTKRKAVKATIREVQKKYGMG
ncbi:hypothetical protein [Photobacterium damselae]|uniref:hypothetical protein n=1 Tax=Photobacterium damselae TaxID=38293 RepID=UPI001EFEA9C6|nr:hypothetical protein [Photobacterium damselae]MCG9777607.1 hypothetical protein [Photobacterium damselae]